MAFAAPPAAPAYLGAAVDRPVAAGRRRGLRSRRDCDAHAKPIARQEGHSLRHAFLYAGSGLPASSERSREVGRSGQRSVRAR
jgi:hypothetical protein